MPRLVPVQEQSNGYRLVPVSPDGATQDIDPAILADAEKMADQIESVEGEWGAGDLYKQSFMLDLGDKVTGVASGLGGLFGGRGFGRQYQVGRLAHEILEQRARERSGRMGTAAEIAGTLSTGVLAKGATALSTLGRVGQTAREAAILGTIQGAGDSQADSVGGVATDALKSGGVSALIGAGAQSAFEIARPIVRGGISAFRGLRNRSGNADTRAAQQVMNAIDADGLTPRRAAGRMRRSGESLIGTADDNVMGLGRATVNRPGPGRTTMGRALRRSQSQSANRAVQAVTDALGGGDIPMNTRVAQMAARRGRNADRAYRPAFKRNFGSQHAMAFDNIARRVPAEAMRNAQRVAQAEGRPFGQQLIASIDDAAGSVTFRRAPSLEEWHYIQRGLRSAADNAYRNNVGEVGTAYKNLRKELIDLMDVASPLYRRARLSYASESQLIDAVRRGRELMSPNMLRNIDQFVDDFATMSRSEREMVRIGLSRGLEDLIQGTPDAAGDVVRRIFGTPAKRAAIRAVFESDTAFRKFQAEMMRQARRAGVFGQVGLRNGSRTAPAQAEEQAFSGLTEFGQDVITGNPGNATMRGLGRLLKSITNMDDEVSARVAKILVEENPDEVLRVLSRPMARNARDQATDRLLARASQIAQKLIASGSAGTGAKATTAQ